MSLKFKKILENHGIDFQELADQVYVTAQTVRNWCRKDGTIPTIDSIYRIAEVLEEYPVIIAKSFVDRPDELPIKEPDFLFHDHSDWHLPSGQKQPAETLSSFFRYKKLSGSGAILYNNTSWSFSTITNAIRGIVTVDYDYDADCKAQEMKDLLRELQNCIGFVFADKYANIISLGTDQIEWWKYISCSYGSINLEMSVKVPIFVEMESEFSKEHECIIRISITNEKHEPGPTCFFLKEPKDVMSRPTNGRLYHIHFRYIVP